MVKLKITIDPKCVLWNRFAQSYALNNDLLRVRNLSCSTGVIKMGAIEFNVVIAYVFGLVLLYIVGWVLVVPLKVIIKLIYNGVLGGMILILLNFVGGFVGIHIGVNPVTALIAGVLGIPGIVLLLILQIIFKV